jgi:acetyl esterase/lipase
MVSLTAQPSIGVALADGQARDVNGPPDKSIGLQGTLFPFAQQDTIMTAMCSRMAYLGAVAAGLWWAGWAGCALGQNLTKKTYTYKTVDGLDIQADVYRPDDAKARPVVVWIHGRSATSSIRTVLFAPSRPSFLRPCWCTAPRTRTFPMNSPRPWPRNSRGTRLSMS